MRFRKTIGQILIEKQTGDGTVFYVMLTSPSKTTRDLLELLLQVLLGVPITREVY